MNQLYNPNKNLLYSFNEQEFDKFFEEQKKNYINLISMPNIFDLINKFHEKEFYIQILKMNK